MTFRIVAFFDQVARNNKYLFESSDMKVRCLAFPVSNS